MDPAIPAFSPLRDSQPSCFLANSSGEASATGQAPRQVIGAPRSPADDLDMHRATVYRRLDDGRSSCLKRSVDLEDTALPQTP